MKMNMIKNNASELCQYEEEAEDKDRRVFQYVINNKRAKAKLLKGAKRGKHLVVESKNGCVNLIFSDGSYLKTVLPLLRSWHKKLNEKILINETEVQVVEIDDGIDDSRKHIDTKLVILANKSRLVIHAYNSKQKLMVQGQDYENFALNCLEPFFKDRIEETIEQITKINGDIKISLDTKKEVKMDKTFRCPQCELTCLSNTDLRVHVKSCHTKPSICSPPRNKVPKVLVEDLSISSLEENQLHEIEMSKSTQDQDIKTNQEHECESCGYTFKDKDDLRKHFEENHMEYFRIKYLSEEKQEKKVDENPSKVDEEIDKDDVSEVKDTNIVEQHVEINCNKYNSETQTSNVLEEQEHDHIEVVIKEKDDVKEDILIEKFQKIPAQKVGHKCSFCVEIYPNLRELKVHIKTSHWDDSPDDIEIIEEDTCSKCPECKFVGSKSEMENHTTIKHMDQFNFKKCDQVFEARKSLNRHIRTEHDPHSEPFPCMLCGLVFATFELLQNHTRSDHTTNQESCKYCDHTEENKEDLLEHMIKEHEDTVLAHTIASLVDKIDDKVDRLDRFSGEVMSLLGKLFEQNNELKQELFLIRNNQALYKNEPSTPVDKFPETTTEPLKKSYKDIVESNIKNIRKEVEEPKETSKNNNANKNDKLVWVGTSLSKTLDIHKFQNDTKSSVKTVKAFGIKREENHLYPEMNFTEIVPEVIEEDSPDTLVLQGGSIEITNIDVKQALMDSNKDIEDYKEEWFSKTEKDSSNLFDIAERAIKKKPKMKVIIVKRLPRNDPFISDPLGIKKKLSKFGNNVYDQLWFRRGAPKNIHIVNFELGCEQSPHLQKLIFGNPASQQFDGIHLRGEGASRHLTYRAAQAIKPVLKQTVQLSKKHDNFPALSSHQNCPQAVYQQEQRDLQYNMNKSQAQMYQNTGRRITYNVPIKNSFGILGNF